ncbi:MAG: serpin family protein [Acidimicrobiales bacterium]|nr:serpin family protein [Acidimicrobiales bacterium]
MDLTTRRHFLALVLASAAASACGASSPPGASDGGSDGGTTPARPSDPELGDIQTIGHSFRRITASGDSAGAVDGDRQLAAKLYSLMAQASRENFIFSPFSIASAFSMLMAGARTRSAEQLASALGGTGQDWHESRNALDTFVRTPTQVPEGAQPLELDIANAPFGQTGFPFEEDFIRVLAEYYGADMRALDFSSDPEAARQLINAWVADQTRDRILDLLPPGSIDALVRLVLVNTVFFKATWFNEFDPARTGDQEFTLLDGSVAMVPTMSGSIRTTFGTGDGWQMVRLPYWGGYSMIVVVPDTGELANVESQLDNGFLENLSATQSDYAVALSFPKFNFKTSQDLIPLFQPLGVVDVFSETLADLTGIAPAEAARLYVSGAFHQATIEVDELGTTATAATALVVGATSAPEPVSLSVDRPFLFVIQHDESGEPLFIGRVTDPRT